MLTGVVANALEACDRQMIRRPAGQQSSLHASTQGWDFDPARDNVAAAHMFGIVENGPGD